ncbi:unnamed protein product (macronuclear) [Paramecium tetraurelia]|uniref:Uncharacterized protein n=1 Tax=Paramecium tetraurelia TaxID=5888 RepID=A0BK56_PARTE|nr:uncharacterized protein GSPATT00029553001 [Paramecium tetraurelia]CAK58923.1 unnamed protein product [Paramecium tetraurelia]|eukprot:XP_001426321.1 hypothetical protein (macronuclear) [Paramecium tetraurelia strain d4-2]
MSVNVIPVVNPHQKMEGIQNVRPEEIKKIIEKAKNLPSKQEGDFVKLQNYEFQVDEFEEMEDPQKNNKKNKKQAKKDSKNDVQESKDKEQLDQSSDIDLKKQQKPKAKEIKKQEKPKAKQKQKEEIEEQQEEQEIQDNKEEEQPQEEEQQQDEEQPQDEEVQPKESEVDQDDMQKQLDEYDEENNQLQQSQAQENSQIQQSQVSQKSSNQKKKKFQSDYAAMMDDLLNESEVSINEEQPKKQKTEEKQMASSQIDAKKEQEYLKIIKQYQQKIKQLNEAIDQQKQPVLSEIIEDQIEEFQEQLDKTEESISNKKHLYPGIAGIGISLYDEFRLPQIVEEQVQHRLKELGVQERQTEEAEQKIKDLEEQHQAELDRIKQNYEEQLQQMRLEIELQQERIKDAERLRYAESEISKVLDKDEIERLKNDPLFSVMSSNLVQSVDSNVSQLMKDESMYLKYRDLLQKYKPKADQLENCMEIVNSKIHDLITLKEAQELNQLNTDSNISVSKVMDIDGAVRLLDQNQNVNSDIDSIISPSEQIKFKKDPKYQEPSLPNSSIDFSIPDNYKLQRMVDSDYSNFNMNINEDGSLFIELQKELEQNYPITESNREIIYQQIIQDQKQEFDKQVKKLQKLKPTYKSKLYFGESIDSSIGSLANEQVSKNISSNISMISKSQSNESIIGSVVSKKEKAELQEQCQSKESSISKLQISKNDFEQIGQISSGISQLNSIVDSYKSHDQTVSSGISKVLNDKQLQKEKYSNIDSSLNISQGGSSIKSFLLLKKSMISKKY